jgi:excisionase family DNA binding protein
MMMITLEAAATRIGCSIATVRRLSRDGALPVVRISRRNVRVPADAVEQYLAGRTRR